MKQVSVFVQAALLCQAVTKLGKLKLKKEISVWHLLTPVESDETTDFQVKDLYPFQHAAILFDLSFILIALLVTVRE